MTNADSVLQAAADLVAAFGSFDRDRYFACFAPEADFTFYNAPDVFTSRAAYEAAWDAWVASGWRVLSCVSRDQRVRVLGDVAIFTHDVATDLDVGNGPEPQHERETIVFVLREGRWLAVHEHLSSVPTSN